MTTTLKVVPKKTDTAQPKKKRGRPSSYKRETADRIIIAMQTPDEKGNVRGLRSILAEPGMPSFPTLFLWLDQNKDFLERYRRAKEHQAELNATILNDLAVETHNLLAACKDPRFAAAIVNAQKLRVDTYKWTAARLLPKVYGDKVALAGSGEDGELKLVVTYADDPKKKSE